MKKHDRFEKQTKFAEFEYAVVLTTFLPVMQSRKTVSECSKIDQLIESFKTLDKRDPASNLGWIPYSELTDIESIESSSNQTIYCAKDNRSGT